MGLPDPRKNKPKKPKTKDEENLEEVARILGCGTSTNAILSAISTKKASFDVLRQSLGLQVTEYMAIDGITREIDKLKEASKLELLIQSVLKAYPFKRATLVVSISQDTHGDYTATLSAQERAELPYSRMPMVDVIEMREKKTAVLDHNTASSMITAVSGLKR